MIALLARWISLALVSAGLLYAAVFTDWQLVAPIGWAILFVLAGQALWVLAHWPMAEGKARTTDHGYDAWMVDDEK